jgi:Protein of unknown function (DUF2384)
MKRPNRALAGHVPINPLDTDAGTEQVMELLDFSIGLQSRRMQASMSVELPTAVEIIYLPLFRLPVS